MINLIYLLNIILGLSGFAIALNIFNKKKGRRPMVCPMNMKCDQVLYSKYARFLGIPLELLGMFYYGLITLSYAIFLLYPNLKNPSFFFSIFAATLAGFVFSAYLISIQAFKLREWCSWCLMSAGISTAIFLVTLQTDSIFKIVSRLAEGYEEISVLAYSLAISIGIGAIFIAEVLFLRFLKDHKISEEENSVLHILRQIVWLSIGIMAISKYTIYLVDPKIFTSSIKFFAGSVILTSLVFFNLIYDILISSKLVEIFSGKNLKINSRESRLKRASFVFGPVTLTSWLLLFVLEMTKEVTIPITYLIATYLAFLIIAILAGMLAHRLAFCPTTNT